MRLIAPKRLVQFARRHANARASLQSWRAVAERARWASLTDVRRDFASADGVTVDSGRVVTVFNIAGNNYRLVTAIHYNRNVVYIMRFYTHPEYGKGAWKKTL